MCTIDQIMLNAMTEKAKALREENATLRSRIAALLLALRKIMYNEEYSGSPYSAAAEIARAALRAEAESTILINEILEQAARVCDEQATEVVGQWHGPPKYRDGARACADRIRRQKLVIDD